MKELILPSSKSNVIRGAGQLSRKWWSNGGYDFTYRQRRFRRLCFQQEKKVNAGYNTVITKMGKSFKGLIWLDSTTSKYSAKELAKKVIKHFKLK